MLVFDLLSPYLYSHPCLAYRPGRVLVERKAPERYDIAAWRHRRPEAQHAAARVDVVHPYPEVPRKPRRILDARIIRIFKCAHFPVLYYLHCLNRLHHFRKVVNSRYALRLLHERRVVVEVNGEILRAIRAHRSSERDNIAVYLIAHARAVRLIDGNGRNAGAVAELGEVYLDKLVADCFYRLALVLPVAGRVVHNDDEPVRAG